MAEYCDFQYFDLQDMYYMDMVRVTGSISKAAKNLWMTQPALSRCVSKVEKQVGGDIFNRSSSPLTLTPLGEKYFEYAARMMALQNQMTSDLGRLSAKVKAKLLIGCSQEHAEFLMPVIMKKFRSLHPEVQLAFMHSYPDKLLSKVKSGQLDYVILTGRSFSKTEDLNYLKLYDAKILLIEQTGVIPAECFDQDGRIIEEKLFDHKNDSMPWIIHSRTENMYGFEREVFERNNFEPDSPITVYTDINSFHMAANGFGIGFIEEQTKALRLCEHNLQFHELNDEKAATSFYLLYRKNAILNKIDEDFIKCVAKLDWNKRLSGIE